MEPQTLYKNEILWAVNKPSRMHFNETLTQCGSDPWVPAHRLDFETSGILIFCPQSQFDRISGLFKDPRSGIQKYYLAGVAKKPSHKVPCLLKGFIASRYRSSKGVKFVFDETQARGWHTIRPAHMTLDTSDAITEFAKTLNFKGLAYEVRLITGARHQIRATFKALDAPIVGDPLYGQTSEPKIQMELHSYRLLIPKAHGLCPSGNDLEITATHRSSNSI